MIDYKKQGKRNRAAGALFELKVRKELESTGVIIGKWPNNIDLEKYKCHAAKTNRFNMRNMGFPDFFYYSPSHGDTRLHFVECKVNGKLSKIEKEKAQWYLIRGYCSKFFIASKSIVNGKIHITYKEVEQHGK